MRANNSKHQHNQALHAKMKCRRCFWRITKTHSTL